MLPVTVLCVAAGGVEDGGVAAACCTGGVPGVAAAIPLWATTVYLEPAGAPPGAPAIAAFALGIDPARHNVRGGGVALGHPIGASGARILTTLLHALEDRGERRGIAALCLGGGNAVAMAIERP